MNFSNKPFLLTAQLTLGNANEILQRLDADSIDLICCDPPYQLDSIRKSFANSTPPKNGVYQSTAINWVGQEWDLLPEVEIFEQCLRVLKPGAFGFFMCTPRQDSYIELVLRLRLAGFDIGFSSLYWCYSSGFPKIHKIDEIVGYYTPKCFKPAIELIIVVQKPMTEKNYKKQSQSNGKGGLYLDDGRIPYQSDIWKQGRFPANLLVEDEILNSFSKYFDLDQWFSETVKELPQKVQETFPVLICSKPSKKEKELGTSKNGHPTVKPLKLMSYLITIGSREGETILDPFMGSGTTGIAAQLLNRDFIGIEKIKGFYEIANKRLKIYGQYRKFL